MTRFGLRRGFISSLRLWPSGDQCHSVSSIRIRRGNAWSSSRSSYSNRQSIRARAKSSFRINSAFRLSMSSHSVTASGFYAYRNGLSAGSRHNASITSEAH